MTDQDPSDEDRTADASTETTQTAPINPTYKVLGEFEAPDGVAVLGQNDAGSGTPIGVQGAVPNNASGYGLDTPDDARIEGDVATTSGHRLTVNGTRTLFLGATKGSFGGFGGNVIHGHPTNAVVNDARGTTIGGGGYNDTFATKQNEVYDDFGTVAGGEGNQAGTADLDRTTTTHATVSGGESNFAKGSYATVGGGFGNTAGLRTDYATVGGGLGNTVTSGTDYATIGGGRNNTASVQDATVAGGKDNTAGGVHATVAGGSNNTASGFATTIGGGVRNTASGDAATVGGGFRNTAASGLADMTIGGGSSNVVKGSAATIGGGRENRALGSYATVPGGSDNLAEADYTFAAGRGAEARYKGSFVWSDSTSGVAVSTGSDEFIVQASGGVGMGVRAPFFPRTRLHVADDFSANADGNPGNNVVLFENISDKAGPNVLGLQAGPEQPGSATNFITFYDTTLTDIGRVEGNGSGGVTYKTSGSDVAEYFPKADPDAEFSPGEVVGLENGRTTRDPTDADAAMVVSTAPMVLGNDNGDDEEYVEAALLGQVPVTVEGPVESGDLLVAGDGVAVARSRSDREAPPVVGLALEDHDGHGEGEVRALVGGPGIGERSTPGADRTTIEDLRDDGNERDARIAELEATVEAREDRIERQRERIDRLESDRDAQQERIDELRSENRTLRAANEALRERVAGIEAHLDIDETPATPADD